jgi:hypothetical protein
VADTRQDGSVCLCPRVGDGLPLAGASSAEAGEELEELKLRGDLHPGGSPSGSPSTPAVAAGGGRAYERFLQKFTITP